MQNSIKSLRTTKLDYKSEAVQMKEHNIRIDCLRIKKPLGSH